MIKTYIATNGGDSTTGSMSHIAQELKVSRQAIHKAYVNSGETNGYKVFLFDTNIAKKRKTKSQLFRDSIDLLKRARLIIDEENERLSDNGEYSYIGIVDDIDRFMSSIS